MNGHLSLLESPITRTERCPMCAGKGYVSLNAVRYPRLCPTCVGFGTMVSDRFDEPMDQIAYQLGLEPVPASIQSGDIP